MGYRAGPVTLSMYIGKPLTNVEPFQKYPEINTRALAELRATQRLGRTRALNPDVLASAIILRDRKFIPTRNNPFAKTHAGRKRKVKNLNTVNEVAVNTLEVVSATVVCVPRSHARSRNASWSFCMQHRVRTYRPGDRKWLKVNVLSRLLQSVRKRLVKPVKLAYAAMRESCEHSPCTRSSWSFLASWHRRPFSRKHGSNPRLPSRTPDVAAMAGHALRLGLGVRGADRPR